MENQLLSPDGKPQIIYWLSRHEILPIQKQGLYFLHGKDIILRHCPVGFRGLDHFLEVLDSVSRRGFAYLVAPQFYWEEAIDLGFTFGRPVCFFDSVGCTVPSSFYHYSDGASYLALQLYPFFRIPATHN